MEPAINDTNNRLQDNSEICKFYKNQNILITGGTGFMGKILIEKLLRTTDVSTIYLLIRDKKGKDVHSRLDEIFENIIFERLKKERPKFRHHVVALAGDCSIAGLGLTITDRQLLISNVNVVFHVAATVRFDENIKNAYSINVKGTKDVLDLCRQIDNFKSLVHVSTAYSNCHLDLIEEKFYDYPHNYENIESVLEKLSLSEADQLTPGIIGKWPNTYSFTKALAESLIRKTGAGLPIGIFRPAIVISTYQEPIPNWVDNLYGPTGACVGSVSGLMHIMQCDKTVGADVVPVDTCIAALVASGWDTWRRFNTASTTQTSSFEMPLYNYVSSVENPMTWDEYLKLNVIGGLKFPTVNAMWVLHMMTVVNPYWYLFLRTFLHTIPACLVDAALLLSGNKPRLVKMYNKIHKFSDVLLFFSMRDWQFRNDNVQEMWRRLGPSDQKLFPFSMRQVPWLAYFRNYMLGIRVYLLGDPVETLERARWRQDVMRVLHGLLIFLINFLGMGMVWYYLFKAFNK